MFFSPNHTPRIDLHVGDVLLQLDENVFKCIEKTCIRVQVLHSRNKKLQGVQGFKGWAHLSHCSKARDGLVWDADSKKLVEKSKKHKFVSSSICIPPEIKTSDIGGGTKPGVELKQTKRLKLDERILTESELTSLVEKTKKHKLVNSSICIPPKIQRSDIGGGTKPGVELKQTIPGKTDEIKLPESELSSLFNKLGIQKYLGGFEEEEYEFKDLAEISVEEIEDLIPKKAPRNRLKRWLASQRSEFAKPVLMSRKSASKKAQLFSNNFRSRVLLLSKTHTATKSAVTLLEDQNSYILQLIANPKPATFKYDAFLSHVQKSSGDLCRSLLYALKEKKVRVWYDKAEKRLDAKGMVEGIFKSSEFVLVMVEDYFQRTWTLFEYLVAMAFEKPVTVLLETDERFGGIPLKELGKAVPEIFYHRISTHEIININRDYFDSFVEKLGERVTRNGRGKLD